MLSGYCNAQNADGTIEHLSTSVDLDSHAGCDDNGALAWGETNISTEATEVEAGLNSLGGMYLISAKCDGVEGSLIVDGRFRNSSGSFAQD